jgi:hypothetical protein
MTVVDDGSEPTGLPKEPEFTLQVGHAGPVDMPGPGVPSPWSSTWAQAREEAEQRRRDEERFSWIKDADLQMLSMGLEPVPCEHFVDAIEQTGEDQFQAIEQRGSEEKVFEMEEEPGPNFLIGAVLVVRSQTVITALKMIIHGVNAPGATARMLSLMAEALPVGAQLDLIVSTPIVLRALDCFAVILSHGWDIDTYCQDPEWKDVMVLWKNRQLHASVRQVDEDGLDAENGPFLKLAVDEAIQTVTDTVAGGATVPLEMKEPEGSDQ